MLSRSAPAILRPCTPLYAHVRPVRPQVTPSTPIKNLYAHIIVRPWAYMGVHVRPQKNPNNFLWAYNVRPRTPMYAHVRPQKKIMGVQCTPTKKYVRPQKWLLSEVHFLLCPDSLALTDA